MPFKSLFNKLSDTFRSNSDATADPAAPNKMLGDLGMEKLKAVITEVTAAFPVFERAGFEVEEVQIEIGLAPKLMPRFKHTRTITPEEQEKLLAEVAHQKLVKFMLISLFKSIKMKSLIQDPKLEFHAIEIDLTAVPSVRGIFRSIQDSDKVVRLSSHETH